MRAGDRHGPRILRFVLVGSAAAATHWLVVVMLVEALGIAPLRANVGGWLLAFVVSFAGHHRLTFRDHRAPFSRSLTRFFLVSAMGFATNEMLFAWSLNRSAQPYTILLAVVLLTVAALTYLLSRYWAFRSRPEA